MSYLAGKTIAITGAASGFGKLVTERVARLGANVVAMDIDSDGLKAIAGNNVLTAEANVTQLEEIKAGVALGVDKWGSIDVMINNAGIMPLAFYEDHAEAMPAWERCIDVNIKGVLNGIAAVYDQMIAQGKGHVVNLSSIYGNFPVVGAGVYGASKAAVDFLSSSLRMETQGKIKVTTVKPTGVPGTNLGTGIVNPEAIVGILGHKAAAYGQLLQADAQGGLAPEYKDADSIEYYALDPEHLADQIVYAINQPWGVMISEITVRASGDAYIL